MTLTDIPRNVVLKKNLKGLIGLINLRIDCIIGVYEHERVRTQPIFVDIKVRSNFASCASSDDLDDTLNYEQLAQLCHVVAKEGQYKLLESYAAEVLRRLVSEHLIEWASIVVKKPEAIEQAECAFVELEYGEKR